VQCLLEGTAGEIEKKELFKKGEVQAQVLRASSWRMTVKTISSMSSK